jgi:hypothetical protein
MKVCIPSQTDRELEEPKIRLKSRTDPSPTLVSKLKGALLV